MVATKLKSLRVLETELGWVAKIGMSGEPLYYSANWEEVWEWAEKEARRQCLARPSEDVRCADYALDVIGISNEVSIADQDEKGNWIIYWR